MDLTRNAVERMLAALDAPAYDLGVRSERGMLPGLANHPAQTCSCPHSSPEGPQCAERAHLHQASR